MTGLRLQITGLTLAILLGYCQPAFAARDIDFEIINRPERVARFSDFYVRVRLKNTGQTPLRGCDGSGDKCVALAWALVEKPEPIVVPRNNVFPIPSFVDDFLRPGESMETNLRIPTGGWAKPEAVISLAAVVKEGPTFTFEERRFKIAVRPASREILNRRFVIRAIVSTATSVSPLSLSDISL